MKKILKYKLLIGLVLIPLLFVSCFEDQESEFFAVDGITSFNYSAETDDYPTVTFTDKSQMINPVYSWDFGDGSGTSTEENPTYDYSDEGTYTVSLSVTNASGETISFDRDVTVDDGIETNADFSYTLSSNGVLTITNESTDADSYVWDFGDETTSTDSSLTEYSYSTPGTYDVELRIEASHYDSETDDDDQTDAWSETSTEVTIGADFSYENTSDTTFTFTNSSIAIDDGFTWTVEDEDGVMIFSTTTTEVSETFEYTFESIGDFTVTLTGDFTDASGTTTETSSSLTFTVTGTANEM